MNVLPQRRLLSSEPFHKSRQFAREYGCDLTVPNGPGLGDAIVFTRLVEDLGRQFGRPLTLLTAGLDPDYGLSGDEDPLAIWRNHAFVKAIVDPGENPEVMSQARKEKDNFPHFDHVILGIAAAYGVVASATKPALYLSLEEKRWAIEKLSGHRRPLLCLHRGGTIQPTNRVLRETLWNQIVHRLEDDYGLIQLGREDVDGSRPGPPILSTSIRQMFSLIWAADGFVGFDSGPAHVAAAFERPSFIFWDAVGRTVVEDTKEPGFAFTNLVRWAYPQNEALVVFGRFVEEALVRAESLIRQKIPVPYT